MWFTVHTSTFSMQRMFEEPREFSCLFTLRSLQKMDQKIPADTRTRHAQIYDTPLQVSRSTSCTSSCLRRMEDWQYCSTASTDNVLVIEFVEVTRQWKRKVSARLCCCDVTLCQNWTRLAAVKSAHGWTADQRSLKRHSHNASLHGTDRQMTQTRRRCSESSDDDRRW